MSVTEQILNITAQYESVLRVTLFGSRARGTHTCKSDYDIAVYAPYITQTEKERLTAAIDALHTLHKIDLVFLPLKNNALHQTIQKEGVILMDKFQIKLQNLQNAFARLTEAVNEYEKTNSLTVRDGAIQRFEFTAELAWKTMRAYLLTLQITEINNPKAVLKEAFYNNLIADEDAWIGIINDRNRTAHLYDEEEASSIFNRIQTAYLQVFESLLQKLTSLPQ